MCSLGAWPQPRENDVTRDHQLHFPAPLLGLLLLALANLALNEPLNAAEPTDSRWEVRAYGLGLYPSGDDVRNEIGGGSATFGISGGTGFGVDLEYLLTPAIGLEAALMLGDYEADFRLDTPAGPLHDSEDISTDVISLGANYHFTPDRRADLFVGIMVAMSTFDGVVFLTEQGLREKRPFDDDVGAGAKLGVALPFGADTRWSFNAQVRYLVIIMEAESASGGRDLDVDPFIPSLGIGYRF